MLYCLIGAGLVVLATTTPNTTVAKAAIGSRMALAFITILLYALTSSSAAFFAATCSGVASAGSVGFIFRCGHSPVHLLDIV